MMAEVYLLISIKPKKSAAEVIMTQLHEKFDHETPTKFLEDYTELVSL